MALKNRYLGLRFIIQGQTHFGTDVPDVMGVQLGTFGHLAALPNDAQGQRNSAGNAYGLNLGPTPKRPVLRPLSMREFTPCRTRACCWW